MLVAKALVHSPPVVILDEPTAGVDVELRRSLWDYMRELNQAGVTIVLTTHYLEEAQELCDRIAIIDRGSVVVCDDKTTLMRRLDEKEIRITPVAAVATLPAALVEAGCALAEDGRIVCRYKPTRTQAGEVLDRLRDAGIAIADLETREADLEDVFVRLTHH